MNKLPMVKGVMQDLKCKMHGDATYCGWWQAMKELTQKLVTAEKQCENLKRRIDFTDNQLYMSLQKNKELTAVIKELDVAVKKMESNALEMKSHVKSVEDTSKVDALASALRTIAEMDISGKKSFMASKTMKELAQEVLVDVD